MDSRKYYTVQDEVLTHVLVSSALPVEIRERFLGFFWTILENSRFTIVSMLNITENDQNIIGQMLADLAEEGYTDFPDRE